MANKRLFYVITFTFQFSEFRLSETITHYDVLEIDPIHARKASTIFRFIMEDCQEKWDKKELNKVHGAKWEEKKVVINFFNFWEEKETPRDFSLKTEGELEKIFKLPITELNIYVGTLNTLKAAEFRTIRDITECTENDLLKFRGFGRKALQNLQTALRAKGLKLAE